MDSAQLELMQTILHNDGEIVLANNERIVVPDTLRFIWEVRLLHFVEIFSGLAMMDQLRGYP